MIDLSAQPASLRQAAIREWCYHAALKAAAQGEKPWQYLQVVHGEIESAIKALHCQ